VDPTRSTGTVYSAPVEITEAVTLKAIAYLDYWVDSSVASASYTVSAGTTLLLDEVGSAAGAYSVARKLRDAYGGSAIRVRRSSDSTEQDIGFSGENLDTAALLTFAGAGDAFIRTIYDQSGNAYDLNQTTAGNQPQIVASGSVLTGSNGKPVARFDGSNDSIARGSLSISLPATYFVVLANKGTTNDDMIVRGNTSTRAALIQKSTGPTFAINSGSELTGPGYTLDSWCLVRAHFVTGTDGIGINGDASTTGGAGDNGIVGFGIGEATTGAQFDISEWIIYPSDVGGDVGTDPATGDDGIVVSNINTFYDLFTP
jgi:hypothetical protein